MKQTTKVIFDILDDGNLEQQFVFIKNQLKTQPFHETNVIDAFRVFQEIKSIVYETHRKEVFEQLSFSKRTVILNYLRRLSGAINNYIKIKSKESIFEIVDSTYELYDYLEGIGIEAKMIQNTEKKNLVKEFLKVEGKIESIQRDIRSIDEAKSNIQSIVEKSQEHFDGIISSEKEVQKTLEDTKQRVSNFEIDLDSTRNSILSIRQDVEDKRMQIVAFLNSIEEHQKHLSEIDTNLMSLKKSNEQHLSVFVTDTQRIFDEELAKRKDIIGKIQDETISLQKEVRTLLQGANAGTLFKTFEEKRKQIEWQLVIWLCGLLFTSAFIVYLSYIKLFNDELSLSLILERFAIILPLIILDVFFIYQYNLKNKIVEEYRFKSSLSLSLFAYNDLIKANDNQNAVEFITESVDKIFTSPFADDTKNKLSSNELKAVKSILSKVYDKADKVIDSAIDKISK